MKDQITPVNVKRGDIVEILSSRNSMIKVGHRYIAYMDQHPEGSLFIIVPTIFEFYQSIPMGSFIIYKKRKINFLTKIITYFKKITNYESK
jgi:type III secretory pathway component EscT